MFKYRYFPNYFFNILNSLLLLFHCSASAKTVSQVYEESLPSIVVVISYDEKNLPLSLGTGFYISPSEVVTNYHVIENASRILIKTINTEEATEIKDVTSYSKGLDIALLDVEPDEAKGLTVAFDAPLKVGTNVLAIGNPSGLEGTISQGIVSALRDVDNYTIIQTTAPISSGSSGGPLLNLNGEVVGITTSAIKGSQSLNFAIPIYLLNNIKKNENWEPARTAKNFKPQTGRTGIKLLHFSKKNPYGKTISYSLKNTTKNVIKNLKYLLVFSDENGGEPLHYIFLTEKDIIAPGASKRIRKGDEMLKGFTTNRRYKSKGYESFVEGLIKAELRVLSYEIVENSNKAILNIDKLLQP